MTRTQTLLLAFALIALGGMCYGLKETVTHHYPAFEARFPNADQSWWNPALSWHSKYEGGIPAQGPAFWGSTTVLVFLTDAYHLFSELDRVFTRCGFVVLALQTVVGFPVFPQRRFFLEICIRMVAGWLAWSAGFHLIYTLIF